MLDPRGRFVIAGGNDFQLHLWQLPDGTELPSLAGHNESIWAVDVSPDGAHAASASSDGTVRLWTTNDWSSAVLRGPDGPVRSVVFSPDGRQLATGHEGGAVLLWDVATHELVRRLGAFEVDDRGGCEALGRPSWHDERERLIVQRACTEPEMYGLDRVAERAHLALLGEVDLVEHWAP